MPKTSGISWLTMTAVNPNFRWVSTIRSWMVRARRGSSPVVGSSNRMISGPMTSARANPARFRMPPLSSAGNLCPMPVSPTASSISRTFRSISASFIIVFSRKGKATFSKTLSESTSAALWNSIANIFRTSLSSREPSLAISISSTSTWPRSGFSSPIICLSNTLLPPPLLPITVVIFPRGISKLTPCRTGCPPSVFSTPTRRITGFDPCLLFITAPASFSHQDRGHKIVPNQDQDGGQHHRLGRGGSQSFGAHRRIVPFIRADPGHDHAEANGLEKSAVDVLPLHAGFQRAGISARTHPQEFDADQIAAVNADEVEDRAEHGHDENAGQHFGRDQVLHGVDRHRVQRVDLLGDAHDADLRRHGRARPPRHHQRRQHRPQFPNDAQGHSRAQPPFRAELPQ